MTPSDRFAPRVAVKLDPPRNRIFTPTELLRYNGQDEEQAFVAIKGTVFDVTRNTASYGAGGEYHVFVGHDASRALAKSSLEPQDVTPVYSDLSEKELKVLEDWYQYFAQRYNIVGTVEHPKPEAKSDAETTAQ